MSPNWRKRARAAHRNAPVPIFEKEKSPSRRPPHAVETGLFFGERVERIRTISPRVCRSSRRITNQASDWADLQDHSVPLL
jgi:hypothetical protein